MPDSKETIVHVVGDGEHLSAIAYRYRTTPDTIWNLPQNADLAKRRKTGNVLAAHDILYVPIVPRKFTSISAGSTTAFVADVPKVKMSLVLSDDVGPITNEPFVVVGSATQATGTTDGTGVAAFEASVLDRVVSLELTSRKHTVQLRVGGLDPIETHAGLQARLYHLGFMKSWPSGAPGPAVTDAVRALQKAAGLPVTGTVDSPTAEEIRKRFGC